MDSIVQNVVEMLIDRGRYRHAQLPLRLGDIDFRFDAVLVGPESADGLVVVVDFQTHTSALIARRVRGLITLLDRLQSRRTVSVVFVVRTSVAFAFDELEKLCHVSIVRPEGALETCIRPLLPLVLPPPETTDSNAEIALRRELENDSVGALAEQLIVAAKIGSDEVHASLSRAIEDTIKKAIGGTE